MADTQTVENSWDQYQPHLTKEDEKFGKIVKEGAIVGKDGHVWTGQGTLQKIMPDEVKALLNPDRRKLFENGTSLGGERCTLILDWLAEDGTMQLKTKTTATEKTTCNISISVTNKALVIVKGLPNIHGGQLTKNVSDVAKYLKEMGY